MLTFVVEVLDPRALHKKVRSQEPVLSQQYEPVWTQARPYTSISSWLGAVPVGRIQLTTERFDSELALPVLLTQYRAVPVTVPEELGLGVLAALVFDAEEFPELPGVQLDQRRKTSLYGRRLVSLAEELASSAVVYG